MGDGPRFLQQSIGCQDISAPRLYRQMYGTASAQHV